MILCFNFIFYKNVQIAQIYPDSGSYINYSFQNLVHFNFINERTFGYPLVIRICYYLFKGGDYLNGVVVFQILVSLISFFYFYKVISIVVKSNKIAVFLTILYASSPTIIGWNAIISTESLSIIRDNFVSLCYFKISGERFSEKWRKGYSLGIYSYLD